MQKNLDYYQSKFLTMNASGICLVCNKKTKFCKSHSIPKFIMKNEKFLLSIRDNEIENFSLISTYKKPKFTGIFKNICPECDRNLFDKYEVDNFVLSNEAMNQIALKSELYNHYATKYKVFYLEDMLSKMSINRDRIKNELFVCKEDLIDFEKNIKNYKNKSFFLLYDEIYNCSDEIYVNTGIIPLLDSNYEIMNDLYNLNGKDDKSVYFYIYPLGSRKLRIIIFSDDINGFKIKQIKTRDKISEILFFIFTYSPNVYFSKKTFEKIDKRNLNEIYNNFNVGNDIVGTKCDDMIVLEYLKDENRLKFMKHMSDVNGLSIFK